MSSKSLKIVSIIMFVTHAIWMFFSVAGAFLGIRALDSLEISLGEYFAIAEDTLIDSKKALNNINDSVSDTGSILDDTAGTLDGVSDLLYDINKGGSSIATWLFGIKDNIKQVQTDIDGLQVGITNFENERIPQLSSSVDEYSKKVSKALATLENSQRRFSDGIHNVKIGLTVIMGLLFISQLPFLYISIEGYRNT